MLKNIFSFSSDSQSPLPCTPEIHLLSHCSSPCLSACSTANLRILLTLSSLHCLLLFQPLHLPHLFTSNYHFQKKKRTKGCSLLPHHFGKPQLTVYTHMYTYNAFLLFFFFNPKDCCIVEYQYCMKYQSIGNCQKITFLEVTWHRFRISHIRIYL